MISLQELTDCKTPEELIDLIHLDAYESDWGEDHVRPKLSQSEQDICTALMREALEYAALGDLEEAKLRARNWFHPKFNSPCECQALYKEAMAGKGV